MSAASLLKITNGLKSFIGRVFNHTGTSSQGDDSVVQLPKSTNPWQEELDRLLINGIKTSDDTVFGDLAASDSAASAQNAKTKRPSDATVKDLKAWWSESIATWEPGIAKSLDSHGQRPRTNNSAHWFQ